MTDNKDEIVYLLNERINFICKDIESLSKQLIDSNVRLEKKIDFIFNQIKNNCQEENKNVSELKREIEIIKHDRDLETQRINRLIAIIGILVPTFAAIAVWLVDKLVS